MNKDTKDYIKFMVAFYMIPTTAVFYWMQNYIHPIISYIIVMSIAGHILYNLDKRSKKKKEKEEFKCQPMNQ